MFVIKYSLLRKVYSGVGEKPLKDSTTTPKPLAMKIWQMTQNCQMNTGKLKRAPLFQK